jgi:predicted alpha/beta superfamily hydrolase
MDMKLKSIIIMRKLFLLLFILIPSLTYTQPDLVKVTIKVITNNIQASDDIYIAGNKAEFGNWQPNIANLEKDHQFWSKSFEFEFGSKLEFKFTKGTWDTEALDNGGKIPDNNLITVTKDTILVYCINSWNQESAENNSLGRVTGNVEHHRQMQYNGLLDRDIIVWLPPGYETNIIEKYPVLYMHDGQNIFDPSNSFTKIDWQIDEAADSLIRKSEIKPIIIVGIYNTQQRTLEYSPGPTSDIYKHFVVEKLKPFIDSTYRTIPDRENTFVGGSSSGGTIAFMLLWEYSNVFSKAACFSPAFVTENFNIVKQYDTSKLSEPVQLYIDNGGVGLETYLQLGIDSMIVMLNNLGYKKNIDYVFILDEYAEHNESAWAKRVPNMLRILFAK